MKKQLRWFLGKLVLTKIYIARTTGWMGIANSIMLVFLVIEKLNSLGIITTDLGNSLIFVIIFWAGALILLGWIEVEKLRAPHMESKKMFEINPPMQHISNTIDRVEKKLLELELKINGDLK